MEPTGQKRSPTEPDKPHNKKKPEDLEKKENAATCKKADEKREDVASSERSKIGLSEKKTDDGKKSFLKVEHDESQGARTTMEDKCIIIKDFAITERTSALESVELVAAVCDGHGGHKAAKWTEERLPKCLKRTLDREDDVETALKKAFEKVDKDWIESTSVDASGTTCCLALLESVKGPAQKKRKLWVANTGDSRCILSRKGEALAMSVDHKPSRKDEKRRIRRSGGYVFKERVMGQLGVSRSIGDSHLKKIGNFIIPTPEVQSVDVDSGDEFAMIACDGLFDVMGNQEIVDLARNMLLDGKPLKEIPAELTRVAIEEKATLDNVSVIAIQFKENLAS